MQELARLVLTEILWVLFRPFGARPGFRAAGRAVLILLSGWLLVFSFWFFASTLQGWIGVGEAVARGAPGWAFGLPLLAMLCLVALALNRPGAYWVVSLLGFAVFVGSLVYPFTLSGTELKVGFESVGLILVAILYSLLAMGMAFGDAVPLTSPLARLVYVGRFGHLKNVYRLAERWGWGIRGPEQPNHAVRVVGVWNGRPVRVASGARYSMSQYEGSAYYLTVQVDTRRCVWPLFVRQGMPMPRGLNRKTAMRGTARNAGGKPLPFYIWTPGGQRVAEDRLYGVQSALESGREFLRRRTMVLSGGDIMVFYRESMVRMTENAEQMERIVQWLGDVARVMEDGGLADDIETLAGEIDEPARDG